MDSSRSQPYSTTKCDNVMTFGLVCMYYIPLTTVTLLLGNTPAVACWHKYNLPQCYRSVYQLCTTSSHPHSHITPHTLAPHTVTPHTLTLSHPHSWHSVPFSGLQEGSWSIHSWLPLYRYSAIAKLYFQRSSVA